MAGPARMLRLLQGDVGSGKTVVALLAMLIAVEAGAQAALMAPTEILARQHYATIAAARRGGRRRGRAADRPRQGQGARRRRSTALATARIRIVVGTHALFQEDVDFQDLALAVVDEQHRFGVAAAPGCSPSKGRAAGCAGDDRDADPAHADADRLWRSRRLAPRPRSRPGASRSTRARCRWSGSTRSSPASRARIERGRAGLLGLPAGRGIRAGRPRRRRGARRRRCATRFGDAGRAGARPA